jgi:hypothetical protein
MRPPLASPICFREMRHRAKFSRAGRGSACFATGARPRRADGSCAGGLGDPLPFPPPEKIRPAEARTGRHTSRRPALAQSMGFCAREWGRHQRPRVFKKGIRVWAASARAHQQALTSERNSQIRAQLKKDGHSIPASDDALARDVQRVSQAVPETTPIIARHIETDPAAGLRRASGFVAPLCWWKR